jgi:cytochrome c-type biogenesis protein CcmH
MKRWSSLAWALVWAMQLALAQAVPLAGEEDAQARRFHALTQELRCVVCQNESLADSTAPLALDLKQEIRTRMAAGESDEQIRAFLVQRYGDFVNYRPPVKLATYLLWLGPLLFVGVGLWVVARHTRTTNGEGPVQTAPGSTRDGTGGAA